MFSNSIKVFTLLGFDIKIDPSWVLIAALIVWSLSTGYFPQIVEGETRETYLTMALLGMLAFFASLILHELAHSLVARRFGVDIKGITLFIFGGVAELESEPKSAGSEFWIAIVGPATSFALALVFWALSVIGEAARAGDAAVAVLDYLAIINLVLAVFNLLPAFPLDGGRVYRAVLWNRSGDILDATRRASTLGSYIAYALIGVGILGLFSGSQVGGLWQVFIGLFLLIAAKSTYQQTLVNAALKNKTVASMMTPDPHTASPDQSLAELVNLVMLRHRTSYVPVVEDGVVLGYVDGSVLGNIDRDNWSSTQVGDVFVAVGPGNSVPPNLPASAVLERMSRAGQRKFMVIDGQRLLGVITLADLLEYLRVLQDLGVNASPPRQSRARRSHE